MSVAESVPYDESLPTHEEMNCSYEIATSVASAAEELRAELPEYLGVTMFGSTVRGEAGPDSDADMFMFVTPTGRDGSPQVNPLIAPGNTIHDMHDSGPYIGSHPFHKAIEIDYKEGVRDMLVRHNVPNSRDADIAVVPVTKQIVADEARFIVDTAAAGDDRQSEVMASAQAFRNVRAMFHAPIDAIRLQPFQRQVVAELAASPYGEEAWAMLRKKVIGFEAGRGNGDTQETPWRNFPATLEDAVGYYGLVEATDNVE